ncbi:MAG: AI-2E family transporter [Oscillospiraceae bacterium]|nr:AI-2E family transporter [Oscillospiraceae bacterium]
MELNKQNIKKILLLITFGIVLFSAVQNYEDVLSIAGNLLAVFKPFFIGCAMAFILNVFMRPIEERLFAPLNRKNSKAWSYLRRPVSLVAAFGIVLGIIFILLFMIIPEIGRTGKMIIDQLPDQLDHFFTWLSGALSSLNLSVEMFQDLQIDWNKIVNTALSSLKTGGSAVVNTTVGITTTIVGGVANLFLGLVFCIYLLLQKETLAVQCRNLMSAFLPKKFVEWVLEVGSLSNRIFSKFVSGQCTEAVILGVLCFIGMRIFSMPYALVISALVGVTALIPVFGAFIGAGVGAFLILMEDPMKAVWFIVFIIVLQQLEGNLIYPRVVGSSVGLPGLWVLMAVTVGSSFGGVTGMLLSVPACSVLYAVVQKTVRERLKAIREKEAAAAASVPQEEAAEKPE